ncbi:predicted protein [Pediculus humanus corporis]|uniref:Probable prefoldin subunit 6 n=1 Tax=Pediculus humanus subsp. corporis TaxID=121224 RepID=E0VED5_PEDHC|nr:uncharacterized protein Phum_PHUM130930 [Pediculus humanus corporis]EEB11741.1 predicted protein [Pediculus humanus corporis]
MSDKILEGLQKNLQKELDSFRSCQKEYQKAITKRQQLDAQLNENTCVKNELDLLEEDGEVFKLIGPVLMKQDLEEAKQNVAKRIEYISGEMLDNMIADIDKKQNEHRDSLITLQKNMQDALTKSAKKG